MNNLKKNIFIKVVIFASFFVLAGCALFSDDALALFSKKLDSFRKTTTSPAGMRIEQILPADTFMMAEISFLNTKQEALWEKLKSKFLQKEKEAALQNKIKEEIDAKIKGYGLTYEADIKPLLTEQERYVVAMSKFNTDELSGFFSMMLKDTKKFDDLLENIAKKGGANISLETYQGAKILADNESRIYLTRIKDLLIAGKGMEVAKEMFDRAKSGKDSLERSADYKKLVKTAPADRIVFLYINAKKMLKAMEEEMKKNAATGNGLKLSELSRLTDMEGLALTAEEEGFKFFGKYFAEAKGAMNYDEMGGNKYLYKDVHGEGIAFYTEGANLKKILETMLQKPAEGQEQKGTQYEQIEASLQKYNLKLGEDVLSWMGKGFAVAAHRNPEGQIIPGVSLIIDASAEPKKAQDLIRMIDAQLTGVVMLFQSLQNGGLAKAVTKGEIELKGGSKMNVLLIDFDKAEFPKEEAQKFASLKGQKIELIYGVTADNKFIISTYQEMGDKYGSEGIDKSAEYLAMKKHIEGYEDGLNFVDIGEVFGYMDNFLAALQTMDQALPIEEQKKIYEEIKLYFKPLKSIIFASKMGKKETESAGFVRIGE